MDVRPLVSAVAAVDAEIVRLREQLAGAADVLDRELAELEIDGLLERRFALMAEVER